MNEYTTNTDKANLEEKLIPNSKEYDIEKNEPMTSNLSKYDNYEEQPKPVPYLGLFKYTSKSERTMLIFAFLGSFIQGGMVAFISVILGDGTNDMAKPGADIMKIVSKLSIKATCFGCGLCLISTFANLLWKHIGAKIDIRIKNMFFKSILVQDTAWYDVISPEKITAIYSEDTSNFIKAVGDQNHMACMIIGMATGGFILGFTKAVYFTLILLILAPLIILGCIFWAVAMKKQQSQSKESYIDAGGKAEQAILGIRTVKSLNGEKHEIENYNESIEHASKISRKWGVWAAIGFAVFFFTILLDYSLGFYIGSKLIENGYTNPNTGELYTMSDIVTTFFAVVIGCQSFGMAQPSISAILKGRESAATIYKIINMKPTIHQKDETKISPKSVRGEIEFKNVKFNYPTRPNIKVLENFNMKIPSGKKIALVGGTGCGKSTCIQLLERFYDPLEGEVLIDGIDLKSYNLTSLRKYIGYVGQEPVLFSMSIKENL